jgi:hypothetical protein
MSETFSVGRHSRTVGGVETHPASAHSSMSAVITWQFHVNVPQSNLAQHRCGIARLDVIVLACRLPRHADESMSTM